MRTRIRGASRGTALPTLACSLVCGGAVVVLSVGGVVELDRAAAVPLPASSGASSGASSVASSGASSGTAPTLAPPAAVDVRVPPTPAVTAAPTAPQWTAHLLPARRR